MPTPPTVEPTMPCLPLRTVPLDEHDTSYFADSASTRNFSIVFSVNIRMQRYNQDVPEVGTPSLFNIIYFLMGDVVAVFWQGLWCNDELPIVWHIQCNLLETGSREHVFVSRRTNGIETH